MKPLVSILIPAYNAEQWVGDTIRSALAQSWEQKEIIVVDDGSTDATADVARHFAPQGVTVASQPNRGASSARNHAYALSRGDYIQWLDADDLLAPNKIAQQMKVVQGGSGPSILLSGPWARFMYRTSAGHAWPSPLWEDLTAREWLLRKLGQNLHMSDSSWLVSRELTEAAGPWNTALSADDDGEYFCRVLLASEGVRFVPDAWSFYRSFGFNSLSKIEGSPQKLASQWLSMQLHIGYLRSLEDSARVRAACLAYLQNFLVSFYRACPEIAREMERTACDLGGRLEPPKLSWKYRWMEGVIGSRAAWSAASRLRKGRWYAAKQWDRMQSALEHLKGAPRSMVGRHVEICTSGSEDR